MILNYEQMLNLFRNIYAEVEKYNQTAIQDKSNDEPQIFQTYFDETKKSYYCVTDGLIAVSEELYR